MALRTREDGVEAPSVPVRSTVNLFPHWCNGNYGEVWRLDTLVTAQGRDAASVSISVFGQPPDTTREQVEAFLHAGAVRVAVWLADCETEHAMGEQLARMANALVR